MTEAEEIKILKSKIIELQTINSYYEGDGVAKLFYSLNRKSAEMADLLNNTNLRKLDLTDAKDKSFERLKVIWNDAASIAAAIKTLGETAGVTGNENSDTAKKIYQRTTPESIADELGENKKQDV
jgi:hypothetical protein